MEMQIMEQSKTGIASETRHCSGGKGALLKPKLIQLESRNPMQMKMPAVMTLRPRLPTEELSACHSGTITLNWPTPAPSMIRPTVN